MKLKFVIAFMSFMLIFSIVAPSVLTLIEVETQTAMIEKGESEKQKEAKEKEVEEKKLISELDTLYLYANADLNSQSMSKLPSNRFAWLREVPIPPPEV